jgi:hypothetical protein
MMSLTMQMECLSDIFCVEQRVLKGLGHEMRIGLKWYDFIDHLVRNEFFSPVPLIFYLIFKFFAV